MKRVIVVFISILITLPSVARDRDDYKNQYKYWFHRWRLINDFMKMGFEQGDGCIASERNLWQIDGHHLQFGDQTYFLGYYISVLATEYSLLERDKSLDDMEQTKTELYYALKTYERLDRNAELLYPFDSSNSDKIPNTPGYFIRDDVPQQYLDSTIHPENYRHFNQNLTRYPGSAKILYHFSDFSRCAADNIGGNVVQDRKKNSPSGDQYTILLMGFRLVTKALPDREMTIKLLDGTSVRVNLVEMVKEYTSDMLFWLKEGGAVSKPYANITTIWNTTISWFVYMPNHAYSGPGAHAIVNAFPLAQMGNFIWGYDTKQPYLGVPSGFHDATTVFNNLTMWKAQLRVATPDNKGAFDTRALQCVLAATTDSWRMFGKNVTEDALYEKCLASDWLGFYMPLWSYCNDKTISEKYRDQVFVTAKNDMNNVPVIGINSLKDLYAPGWAVGMKWNRSPKEQKSPENHDIGKGFHNGLDFMLEHNLYYLTYGGDLPKYTNMVNRSSKEAFRPSPYTKGPFTIILN